MIEKKLVTTIVVIYLIINHHYIKANDNATLQNLLNIGCDPVLPPNPSVSMDFMTVDLSGMFMFMFMNVCICVRVYVYIYIYVYDLYA
jgi:hypothetical protein